MHRGFARRPTTPPARVRQRRRSSRVWAAAITLLATVLLGVVAGPTLADAHPETRPARGSHRCTKAHHRHRCIKQAKRGKGHHKKCPNVTSVSGEDQGWQDTGDTKDIEVSLMYGSPVNGQVTELIYVAVKRPHVVVCSVTAVWHEIDARNGKVLQTKTYHPSTEKPGKGWKEGGPGKLIVPYPSEGNLYEVALRVESRHATRTHASAAHPAATRRESRHHHAHTAARCKHIKNRHKRKQCIKQAKKHKKAGGAKTKNTSYKCAPVPGSPSETPKRTGSGCSSCPLETIGRAGGGEVGDSEDFTVHLKLVKLTGEAMKVSAEVKILNPRVTVCDASITATEVVNNEFGATKVYPVRIESNGGLSTSVTIPNAQKAYLGAFVYGRLKR